MSLCVVSVIINNHNISLVHKAYFTWIVSTWASIKDGWGQLLLKKMEIYGFDKLTFINEGYYLLEVFLIGGNLTKLCL